MIGLLLFVEILLLRLVFWVTRVGSLKLSLIFSLTLHTMNFRKRCYTSWVLMMVLH
jgi:hypothetical protein